MKVLLMGATGKAATPAIKALQEKGLRPVAAVRDIPKAKKHLGEDLDFVHFDYTDPNTFAPALKGVKRLFLIPPPGTKDPATVSQITEIAKSEDAELIVVQTGRTSSSVEGKPLNQIEKNLKDDSSCCIIRPALYMQNFCGWAGETLDEDKLYLPAGDAKMSFVALKDLGAAIAAVLSSDGHGGKRYNITGPAAIDHYQVAAALSKATGRSIQYEDISEDTYVHKMMDKDWTEKTARYIAFLFKLIKGGTEEAVSDDFSKLVGREPTPFETFAMEEFGN